MNIDINWLKSYAAGLASGNGDYGAGQKLLEIAGQIEVLQQAVELHAGYHAKADKFDRIQAENEALRKQAAADERKLDALLNHCDDGECVTCGQIICPHGDGMHFHHDGCPSCAQGVQS